MGQNWTIYRVAVQGLHCRSSKELIKLRFANVPGVAAATVDDAHVLTVFADQEVVSPDDVVRTLIDAGFVPAEPVAVDRTPADVVESLGAELVAEESVAVDEAAPISELVAIEAPVFTQAASGAASESYVSQPAVATAEAEQALQADIDEPVVDASPRASLVQRIKVHVSDNYYPNRIDVIPGVPVEIEFGEGHGCLARVLFEEFGIEQDLTDGGAIVRLPGLNAGEYVFSCGMKMVFGRVVA